jgi:hypothetical protein
MDACQGGRIERLSSAPSDHVILRPRCCRASRMMRTVGVEKTLCFVDYVNS